MRRRTEAHRPTGASIKPKRSKSCFAPEVAIVPKMNYQPSHRCPEFNALAASKLLSVITCQWLDMSLRCWTPVQEYCTVCGFSEPTVFTKTVWTKFFAVWYWPSCCTQYASPAWSGFCSAADNGELDRFLNRCRKLYRCQQLNQDISEFFNLADHFFTAKEQSSRPPSSTTCQINSAL